MVRRANPYLQMAGQPFSVSSNCRWGTISRKLSKRLMKAAVIVFPGSNCDRDVCVALEYATDQTPASVWHRDSDPSPVDLIVVTDGFSYAAEAGHPRQSGQAEEIR